MSFVVSSSGDFSNTEAFLAKLQKGSFFQGLDSYGQYGVDQLRAATPVDSGLAASSWAYRTNMTARGAEIVWYNTDIEQGFNVALKLQLGYSTGTGGYVQGVDYINPAMRPVFQRIVEDIMTKIG